MTSTQKPEVSLYNLLADNGRKIRKATQVTFPNGKVFRFIERVPSKREAIALAERYIAQGID